MGKMVAKKTCFGQIKDIYFHRAKYSQMKNCKYVFPFLVYEIQIKLCANKLCFVSCGRVLHNEYI